MLFIDPPYRDKVYTTYLFAQAKSIQNVTISNLYTLYNLVMKMKWQEIAKNRMAKLGVSQEKASEYLGVTKGAFNHWLNGRREPSISQIGLIFDYLGIKDVTLAADGEFFVGKSEASDHKVDYQAALSPRKRILLELFDELPDSEADDLLRTLEEKKQMYDALYAELEQKKRKKKAG